MNNRRDFFKKAIGLSGIFSLQALSNKLTARELEDSLSQLRNSDLPNAVKNEELWASIRQAFTISPNIIDLNSGGVSPQTKSTQDAQLRYIQMCNEAPSYYMWRVLQKGKETIRRRLATLGGCDNEELALTRNTTESLTIIMQGRNWLEGDEVVLSRQDYSTVKLGWEQLSARHRVKLNWVDMELPTESESDIVEAYINAMTPKTKVVNITQVLNWNGQVIPVRAIRKICDEARSRGIFTVVDGAHAFAQLDFRIDELGCDAFGASLHKWLCAPFGTGILYLRKEKIEEVWPLFLHGAVHPTNIRKFEHFGTYNIPMEQAIGQAIDFHDSIGTKLKEARLRYLKDYWSKAVAGIDRVQIHHSMKARFSCALGLFSIDGMDRMKVLNRLWTDYRVHATNSLVGELKGARITPNIFTSLQDLDILVDGIRQICKDEGK